MEQTATRTGTAGYQKPMEERRRLLALVDIFELLPPLEIERLASLRSFVSLRAREAFPLNEDRQMLLVLADGKVRVYEANPAGKNFTVSVVQSGSVIGQTGFLPWRLRELCAETLEPSLIFCPEWEDFKEIVRCYPEVGIRMMELLAARLSDNEDRLFELTRKEVPARLASLIRKLVEYEGVVTSDGGRRIPTRYTHQQLASMIGADREAVTRAFGRLKNERGVQLRKRYIHVTDMEALERASG
jgi:CRP/FNR family transcriptional regulator